MTDVTIGGDTRPSIAANGSTRLTYHVTVPNHARLRVALGLTPETGTEPANGVLFLIGVSDGHSYQTLRSITLAPYSQPRDRRWQDVSVSLEEYADLTVDLVLNTRAGAAADGVTVRGA